MVQALGFYGCSDDKNMECEAKCGCCIIWQVLDDQCAVSCMREAHECM